MAPSNNFLNIEIDTRSIDRFVTRFPVTAPRVVEQELRRGMDEALEYVLGQVVDRSPVNTGVFRASIFDEIVGVKAGIGGIDVEGVVSSSDYAPKVRALEYGWKTKTGKMPPVEAIALWVRRKGIAGTYSVKRSKSGRHKRLGSKETQRQEDLAVAWAIAVKMKQGRARANLPKKIFELAREVSSDKVNQIFVDARQRILLRWSIESGGVDV